MKIKNNVLCGVNKFRTEISIPNGVTSIGDHAFKRCSKLTSIEIPDSVTEIGKRAFEGCDSLTHLRAPIELLKEGYLKSLATLTALKCKEDRPLNDDVVQYAFRNKEKIMTIAIEQDDDQLVAFYIENKRLKKRDVTSTYLKAADDAKAVKCAALLLEFANEVGSNRKTGPNLELS